MSASISRPSRNSRADGKNPATVASSTTATVLTMLPLLVGFYDPSGALIDTKTALDPRECYCNDYNEFSSELGTGIVARPIL